MDCQKLQGRFGYNTLYVLFFSCIVTGFYDDSNRFAVFNKLSETNYFLIPFLTQSDDEAMQRLKNHMDGERKAKYYGQYLANLSRAIRSIFSEDSSDELESDYGPIQAFSVSSSI